MDIALTEQLKNFRLLKNRTARAFLIDYRRHIWTPRVIYAFLVIFYPLMVVLFEHTGGSDWGGITQTANIILGILAGHFLLIYAHETRDLTFRWGGHAFLSSALFELVYLLLTSPWVHQRLGISTPFLLMHISGAYLVGPLMLAILLLIAPFSQQMRDIKLSFFDVRFRIIKGLLLVAVPLVFVLCRLPLQKYFNPEQFISRPVDLLPGVIFAIALFFWIRRHLSVPTISGAWMIMALGLLVASQIMLSMSGGRFDFYFQLSLGYRQLAILAPVCGIIFYQFIEQNRLEQDLGHLKAERESTAAADLAKSEFITHISHEIRTPINGIIGLAELVMATPPSFQQQQYLQMLRNSANQLLHPLGEILDLARIESGQLDLEQKDFNLRELVDQVSDAVVHQADEKRLELTMLVQHDVPEHLVGDSRRLKQVLTNLLDNAIKFSDRGGISIKIYQTEKGRSKVRLHVAVADKGIGIAPEFHETIFNRFAQANADIFQQYGGTGLGLTLARKIVTELGGEIWVESELGKGSIFHFTAIFGLQKNEKNHEMQRDMRQAEILIIDSNRTSRESLKEMLQAFECQVLEGADETEGLEILAQTDALQFLICNYQMAQPVALSFIRRVRQMTVHQKLPVLFLVSVVADHDTSELESLPGVWFIPKPVKQSQLFDVMMDAMNPEISVANQTEADTVSRLQEIPKMRTPVNILLVEDNRVNQTVARGLLNKAGIFIDVVENGQRALEILRKKKYDIILMDVQMPEMDGIEATHKIRNELNLKEIPIVAITAHALKGDRERCLAAGMNDYISKPIRPEQLYRILNQYFVQKMRIEISES